MKLKIIRICLAVVFWLGITLLFLDISGALHVWLGWMARVQFLPAVMALNVAVIITLILLTLVFGRVYCSVVCPLGVFQDGIAHIAARHRARHGKRKAYAWHPERKIIRYAVWVIFVVALLAGIQPLVALLAPYSSWGRMVQSLLQPLYLWANNALSWLSGRLGGYAFYPREVWLRSLPVLVVSVATLVLVTVLAARGGRSYCNDICPVGTTLSFFSRFALLRPVIDSDKCRNCKMCEHACKASCINIAGHKIDYSRCVDCFNCLDSCKFDALHYRFAYGKGSASASGKTPDTHADASRRAFLSGALVLGGGAVLKAQEQKLDGGLAPVLPKKVPSREVPLTPAGSVSVKDFYRRCTACQLCVAECPNNVLRPSASLERLMQPEMSFERGYCRPECTRCSEVCPSGAILKITPEEKTAYHVGTAHVNRELCQTELGTKCGNCARHCPSGAITMVQHSGIDNLIPVVDETLCIGCGACENLCPVRPVSAITINGRHSHLEA